MTGDPVEPGPSDPANQRPDGSVATESVLPASAPTAGFDPATGRPIGHLPVRELLRISLYWLGLSAIFSGLNSIMIGRLEFTGLVPKDEVGRSLFLISVVGVIIAIIVQPTVGSISDYTISRWGRRKPYIFIGSTLDVVFLIAIANSNTLLAIAAFIALLQFSSNFAQGPFQGYVPDLVPAAQVGFASALVGLMQVFGNVTGFVIGGLATATNNFALGLVALGVLEFVTMLSVVIRVREGPKAKPRAGRSWFAVAAEAWGTDILREHSFLWLVSSRLAILMAGSVLTQLATPYLTRAMGLDQTGTGVVTIVMVGLVALGTLIAVVPSARISDRVGRKPVIWVSCALGGAGLAVCALAPSLPFAYLGAFMYGVSAGIFLAVDWALMTDIIPKASSGRYMGLSNVATASAGVLAIAIGGTIIDLIGGGQGPRTALLMAVGLMALGAILLRPVSERRREDYLAPDPAVAVSPGLVG
jgi:MFS family permease